jgi:WD40 repeat protein
MKNMCQAMWSVPFIFVLSACQFQASSTGVTTVAPTATVVVQTGVATVASTVIATLPSEPECKSFSGKCPAWSPAAPVPAGVITAANLDQLSALAELSNFPVYAMAWSDDAKRLALTGPAGIVVYAIDSWQLLLAIDMQGYPTFGMSLSPDGKTLAYSPGHNPSVHIEQVVHLVDIDSGRERTALKGHEKTIWHIAFSPDGSQVATNSDDYQIWIWDIQSGAVIKKFTEQPAQATLTFSPDGKSLLVEPSFGVPFVLDLQTDAKWTLGQIPNDFLPHIYSAAFSPDGSMVLVGSDDHQLHLWNVASQKEVRVWMAHADAVDDVTFAPDGKLAVSSSRDGTIKFWDTGTQKLISTLTQADSSNILPVYSVMFSPDGKYLMACLSEQLTLWVWGVKP